MCSVGSESFRLLEDSKIAPHGTSVASTWVDHFERTSVHAATLHLMGFAERLATGQAWPIVRAALDGAASAAAGCGARHHRADRCRARLAAPLQQCVKLADAMLRDVEPPPHATVGPQYIDDAVRRGAGDGAVQLIRDEAFRGGAGCQENVTFGGGPGRG